MLFDYQDQERIGIFNGELLGEPVVRLELTADPRSPQFEAFAADFSVLAPKVRFKRSSGEASSPPAIHLGESWHYHAVPLSAELEPFLLILRLLDGCDQLPSRLLSQRLEAVSSSASLEIFVAPHCPFCPEVVKQLAVLPLANQLITVTVIDGTLFPEMSQAAGVKSAPTSILDGEFRWTGQLQIEELADTLVFRDAARLDQTTLVDMLKEGNAARLAQMMLRRQQIFPAFVPLLGHAEWSVRLGAMVVLEDIAARDSGLAHQTVASLWQLMESAPESIRGDLIYLLGQVGDRSSIGRLRTMLVVESSDEVREVLEEALAALAQKGT